MPSFAGLSASKGTAAVEYCFPNYSLIGMWSFGAKVRCETKKNLNTLQSMPGIFINYDSNNTDESAEFWHKLFYLVQML